MNTRLHIVNPACKLTRAQFSAYLDGELSGRSMAAIAAHMATCSACTEEFAAWRSMSDALATTGRLAAPANLQARLRSAIHRERLAETHLPAPRRFALFIERGLEAIGPMAARATAGLVIAAGLLGGLTWAFGGALSVEANDDKMANLSAPHYLYSPVTPQPIVTPNDAPIVIDAKVDSTGRVYDFSILAGPSDAGVRREVEENLLDSIFRPATVFGAPVSGHIMLTYSGVSVRG